MCFFFSSTKFQGIVSIHVKVYVTASDTNKHVRLKRWDIKSLLSIALFCFY